MFIALDKENNRVDIGAALKTEEYFCPGCGGKLVIKAANSHHVHKYYSHLPGSECTYAVNHDMSEWHYNWQCRFPVKNREIPMPKIKPVHRADICIGGRVIEFQHSHISEEEFASRNRFYLAHHYRLIWVFDMTDHLKRIEDNTIVLKKRNNLFCGYNYHKSGFELLFEINEKLYWVSRMDDTTGRYCPVNPDPMEKEMFVLFLSWQVKMDVKQRDNENGGMMVLSPNMSSNQNKIYNRNLPGYSKFKRQHPF